MPYLSLPVLTASLRKHGYDVEQRDLNVELYDALLTRASIEAAVEQLRQEYGPNAQRTPARAKLPDREAVRWAIRNGSMLAEKVEKAKSTIRSPAFYDGPRSLEAFLTLTQCLGVVSLPYYPAELEFTRFRPAHPENQSRALLKAVKDPRTNPFIAFFRKRVLPDLERAAPDLIGISIPTQNQMLAGMTLAYMIKQAGLRSHITVGGPHITMLREQLPRVASVFDLIDSAVVGAGEEPLRRLAGALAGGEDLGGIPNLIYRDPAKQVHVSLEKPAPNREGAEEADTLPDFDGLPLDRYFAPERILPMLTARGCYHGKCAFCNVGYGWASGYNQLTPEQVVEQMLALHEKYGTRHIFMSDEAISPKNLRRVAALLEERGSPVHWGGCVRFERPLTAEILNAFSRGGGRMMLFGLETASEPMIERMDKGTRLVDMGRILKEGAEAGIWNHTFFFFGFPGETMQNAQETVNFVYAHQPWIHSASLGTFLLERYAPAHLYPEQFGIQKIVERPEDDLAIYFDYQLSEGIDEATAEMLVNRLVSVIPQKRFGHYYIHDTYKLLYSAFLHDQGQPLPAWLVGDETG
jgi:hypothetical protein